MLWNFLREKVKQSVLAGVSDALVELDGLGENGAVDAVALLRARLQPALPAPDENHDGNGRAIAGKTRKKAE